MSTSKFIRAGISFVVYLFVLFSYGCAKDALLLDRDNSDAVPHALEAQKLRAAKMDEANQRDARELEPKVQELLGGKPPSPSANASTDSASVLK